MARSPLLASPLLALLLLRDGAATHGHRRTLRSKGPLPLRLRRTESPAGASGSTPHRPSPAPSTSRPARDFADGGRPAATLRGAGRYGGGYEGFNEDGHGSGHGGDCEGGVLLRLQIEIRTDDSPCETSWVLRRIVPGGDVDGDTAHVQLGGHRGAYYDVSDAASREMCLGEGRYEFTITDAFGDGIAAPGYYLLALDGEVIAGSSDFGWEETTTFSVAAGSGGGAGGMAGRPTEGTVAESSDDADVSLDDPSLLVPDRLSGIIDAALADDSRPPTISPSGKNTAVPSRAPITSTSASKRTGPMIVNTAQVHDGTERPASASNPPSQLWTEILREDFEDDLGVFRSSIGCDGHVTYYPFVKRRRGVVRLQNERAGTDDVVNTSICSETIGLDPSWSGARLVFSFYANSMESHDGFCLDRSSDGGLTWRSETCWHGLDDFDNGTWYDDVAVAFDLEDDRHNVAVDGLSIRFRSKANSLHDDILIDRVRLLALVETGLKDSML